MYIFLIKINLKINVFSIDFICYKTYFESSNLFKFEITSFKVNSPELEQKHFRILQKLLAYNSPQSKLNAG